MNYNGEYGVYNGKVSMAGSTPHPPSASSWVLPPHNCVNVNVDAHVLCGRGVCFGVVIRDEEGKLLLAAVKRMQANWTPTLAEARAARYGVEVARRLGYANVILECDAMNVVRAIQEKQEGAAPFYLFYDDILKYSTDFTLFKCVHVRRGGNTLAHSVARWETDVNSGRICMNSFPQSLYAFAELDLIQYLLYLPLKKKMFSIFQKHIFHRYQTKHFLRKCFPPK